MSLLNDPLYLGLRRSRIRGPAYDEFVDDFARTVRECYSNAFLHFEDFGVTNAGRLLNKYRPQQALINDDIQGTAAVVLAALMSACKVSGTPLKQQRICVFGFGSAGQGISEGIRTALMVEGLTSEEARKVFYVLDRPGLLTTSIDPATLREGQSNFLRDAEEVEDWARDENGAISLAEVIRQAKPTALIGCSTKAGAFDEQICRLVSFSHPSCLDPDASRRPALTLVSLAFLQMAKNCDRPIIFPLSNPTRLAEADPSALLALQSLTVPSLTRPVPIGDVNTWTGGHALIATGSPFPPVKDPQSGVLRALAEANK